MTTPKSPMEQFLDEDVATAIAPLRGLLDDGVLEAFGDAWRDAVYGEAPHGGRSSMRRWRGSDRDEWGDGAQAFPELATPPKHP